jgi:hypothetical protein
MWSESLGYRGYTVYLPRAIKVFERVAGAAGHRVCLLSKNGGMYKNEDTVSILIESR